MTAGRPRIKHICLGPSSGGDADSLLPATQEERQDAVDLSELCYLQSVDESGKPCCTSAQFADCSDSRLKLQCAVRESDPLTHKNSFNISPQSISAPSFSLHPSSSPVFLNTLSKSFSKSEKTNAIDLIYSPNETDNEKCRILELPHLTKTDTSTEEKSFSKCREMCCEQFKIDEVLEVSQVIDATQITRSETSVPIGSPTVNVWTSSKKVKSTNFNSCCSIKEKKRSRKGKSKEHTENPGDVQNKQNVTKIHGKSNNGRRILSRRKSQKEQKFCASKKETKRSKQNCSKHLPCTANFLTNSVIPTSKITDELVKEVKVEPLCIDEATHFSDGITIKWEEDRNLRPVVIIISPDSNSETSSNVGIFPKTSLSAHELPLGLVKSYPNATKSYGNDSFDNPGKCSSSSISVKSERKNYCPFDSLRDTDEISKSRSLGPNSSSCYWKASVTVCAEESDTLTLPLEEAKEDLCALTNVPTASTSSDQYIGPNNLSDLEFNKANSSIVHHHYQIALPVRASGGSSPNNAGKMTHAKRPRLYEKRNYLANHFCRICHLIFPTIDRLKAHKRLHVRKYQCQFCTKIICSEGQLFKHLEEVHRMILVVPDLEVEHRTIGTKSKLSDWKPTTDIGSLKRKLKINSQKSKRRKLSRLSSSQSEKFGASRSVDLELGITIEVIDHDEETVNIVLNEQCTSGVGGNAFIKNASNLCPNNELMQCISDEPFIIKEENKTNASLEVEAKILTTAITENCRQAEYQANGLRACNFVHTRLKKRVRSNTEYQKKKITNQYLVNGRLTEPYRKTSSVLKDELKNNAVPQCVDVDKKTCKEIAGGRRYHTRSCFGTLRSQLTDGLCSEIFSGFNSSQGCKTKCRLRNTCSNRYSSQNFSGSKSVCRKMGKFRKGKILSDKDPFPKMSYVKSPPQTNTNSKNVYNLRNKCIDVGGRENEIKVKSKNMGLKPWTRISEVTEHHRIGKDERKSRAEEKKLHQMSSISYQKGKLNLSEIIREVSGLGSEQSDHLAIEALPVIDEGRMKINERTPSQLDLCRSLQKSTPIQADTDPAGENVVQISSIKNSRDTRKARLSGQVVLKRTIPDIYSRIKLMKEKKTYPCPFKGCHRVMASAAALKYHRETHESLSFDCHVCTKVFRHKMNLRNHLLIHKEHKYECPTCQRKFRQNVYLQRHIQERHLKLAVHSCKVCPEKFVCYRELVRHRQRHSLSGGRDFICSVCHVGFVRKTHLTVHQVQHTVGPNSRYIYTCRFCPDLIVFRTFVSLKQHYCFIHPDEILPSARDCKVVVAEESCVGGDKDHLNQDSSSFKEKIDAFERRPLPPFSNIGKQKNTLTLNYDSFSAVYCSEDEVERAAETNKAVQSIQTSNTFSLDENSGVEIIDDTYFQHVATHEFHEEPNDSQIQMSNHETKIKSDIQTFRNNWNNINETNCSSETSGTVRKSELLTSKTNLDGGYTDETHCASPFVGQTVHSDSSVRVTFVSEFMGSKPEDSTFGNYGDPISECIGHNVEVQSSNTEPSYFDLCTNSVDLNNNFDYGNYLFLTNSESFSKFEVNRNISVMECKENSLLNASFGDSDGFESGYLSSSFVSEVQH